MKRGQWIKLLIGLIAVFALFQWLGDFWGSDRGQAGVIIGLLVVAATLGAEGLFFGKSFKEAFFAVGLGFPARRGILAAIVICLLLLLMIAIFASAMNVTFSFYPNWYLLIPGLFFQAGIAEETLFRGYLFGHLRQKHIFWKAAGFAAIPFILVHLILFYSLDWSLAGASILLAVAMSFPLSRLFELGGDTVWAPAIVHFVAQGIVKILVAEGESAWLFPFFWISACAIVPLCVYLLPLVEKTTKKTPLPAVGVALLIFVAAQATIGQDNAETSSSDFWMREELTGRLYRRG